jgi:hypothetical protein
LTVAGLEGRQTDRAEGSGGQGPLSVTPLSVTPITVFINMVRYLLEPGLAGQAARRTGFLGVGGGAALTDLSDEDDRWLTDLCPQRPIIDCSPLDGPRT